MGVPKDSVRRALMYAEIEDNTKRQKIYNGSGPLVE
jgi:hypothetical protein